MLAFDSEEDTEVHDVESPPFRPTLLDDGIAIGRVSTEELTMHVMVDSNWHRVMPDQTATSCEKPWHAARSATRRGELLEHPLCPMCFTPEEHARADAAFVRVHGLRWFQRQFGREPTFAAEWFLKFYGREPPE